MDGDIGFGYTHRQKRTHGQMEHDRSASPTWSSIHRLSASREPSLSASGPSRPQISGLHLPPLPRLQNMPAERTRRFAGDGFDFRRPAPLQRSSTPAREFIDLTADDAGPSAPNSRQDPPAQRPPRFAREIIDVDDEDGRPLAAPRSPEIEFLSARRIEPVRNRISADDEVEITGSAPVPEDRRMILNVWHDLMPDHGLPPHGHFANLRAQIQRAVNRHPVVPPRQGQGGGRARFRVDFVAPNMNFETAAFDMGFGGNVPAPPPPTYDAPPPAPEGFTRTVAEDDELICPNCEDELCLGATDIKKQVWIVKGCGHVYCGECTANRFSTKRSSKGKEKAASAPTKPFKQCVVENCGKKVSNRSAMIQVFL